MYFSQQKERKDRKEERKNQRQCFTYGLDVDVLLQSYSHFLVPIISFRILLNFRHIEKYFEQTP